MRSRSVLSRNAFLYQKPKSIPDSMNLSSYSFLGKSTSRSPMKSRLSESLYQDTGQVVDQLQVLYQQLKEKSIDRQKPPKQPRKSPDKSQSKPFIPKTYRKDLRVGGSPVIQLRAVPQTVKKENKGVVTDSLVFKTVAVQTEEVNAPSRLSHPLPVDRKGIQFSFRDQNFYSKLNQFYGQMKKKEKEVQVIVEKKPEEKKSKPGKFVPKIPREIRRSKSMNFGWDSEQDRNQQYKRKVKK